VDGRAVEIEVEIKDEKVVLCLRGDPEPSQVQDKVNDLLREGYKDFTVDWNDVSIDSAVFGVLVSCTRVCRSPDPFAPFAPDVRWRLHAVGAFGIVVGKTLCAALLVGVIQ